MLIDKDIYILVVKKKNTSDKDNNNNLNSLYNNALTELKDIRMIIPLNLDGYTVLRQYPVKTRTLINNKLELQGLNTQQEDTFDDYPNVRAVTSTSTSVSNAKTTTTTTTINQSKDIDENVNFTIQFSTNNTKLNNGWSLPLPTQAIIVALLDNVADNLNKDYTFELWSPKLVATRLQIASYTSDVGDNQLSMNFTKGALEVKQKENTVLNNPKTTNIETFKATV